MAAADRIGTVDVSRKTMNSASLTMNASLSSSRPPAPPPPRQRLPPHIIDLLSGGLAGCVAKTFTAPLDRVKILFQGSNPNFRQFTTTWQGPFLAVHHMYRYQGGLRACFKGHSATLARIFPYAAMNYMFYEQYKRVLNISTAKSSSSSSSSSSDLSVQLHLQRMLAGSAAGITSVLFTYPLDYIHSRMSYQVKLQRYTSISQTFIATIHEGIADAQRIANASATTTTSSSASPSSPATASAATATTASTSSLRLPPFMYGIRALYRGFGPTVMGIIPYAGVSFATYDTLKQVSSSIFGSHEPSVPLKLVCGAMAGAAAQTASYPLDVIRRRMQLIGLASQVTPYRNTWHAFRTILQQEGLRGLYIGLSINYAKVGPAHAISFVSYEWAKKQLNQIEW